MRIIVLGLFLFGFWLALSGHYTLFLMSSGLIAAALIAVFVSRMGAGDEEGVPLQVFLGIATYYPWLALEILKSAWSVSKIILHPRMPISPVMTTVLAHQRTAVGMATYANSITLTPGTVSTGVYRRRITVYALTRAGADDVEAGEMDRRVKRFEGT